MIVIIYVEKDLEAIVRIMRKHNVPVAMKAWKASKDFWCTRSTNKTRKT